MADSDTTQQETSKTVDTTQQVTSQTPTTKQKNPKRVAAGKLVAERTKRARKAQKKAYFEAQMKKAYPQSDTPSADTPSPPPVTDTPSVVDKPTKNFLTTTQWLSFISIVLSFAGIYYKREEIKTELAKKGLLTKTPPLPPPAPTNSPVLPRRGIRPMD